MIISKKQSKIAIGLIFIVFFLLTTYYQRSSNHEAIDQPPSPDTAPETHTEASSNSLFALTEFHRVGMKNNRLSWEVKAKQGQFFANSNEVKLLEATFWSYRENGDVIEIQAKEATLNLEGKEVTNVTAYNGVKIILNQRIEALTEKAVFDRQKNTLTTPESIVISGQNWSLKGESLQGDLNKNVFKLTRNVYTILNPAAKAKS